MITLSPGLPVVISAGPLLFKHCKSLCCNEKQDFYIPNGVVKDEDALGTSLLLQKLFDLLVIGVLDARLIREILLLAHMLDELEPSSIKRHLALFASNIVNDDRVRFCVKVRLLSS